MLRIVLAALHLLALGIGLGAVLARGSFLRSKLDETAVRMALRYDTLWGIAAFLWISTGLWRWLASIEKSASYYTGNHIFLTKLGLLLLVLALEIKPMLTLGRWRKSLARGTPASEVAAPADAVSVARISHIEAMIVVIMVVLAVAVARGFGG
jgi:putative membrane protein